MRQELLRITRPIGSSDGRHPGTLSLPPAVILTPPLSPNPSNFRIEPAALWKRTRNRAIVVAFFTLLFALSPLLIPIAAVTRAQHRRRIRRAAQAFTCPRCAAPLGTAAIPLAREQWRAELDDYQRRNPGLRFNVHPYYDAVCPRCRSRYAFRPGAPSFDLVTATL